MKTRFIVSFLIFLTSSITYSQAIQFNNGASGNKSIVIDNKIYLNRMIVKFKNHPIEFASGSASATYSNIKSEYVILKSSLKNICDREDINSNEILFHKALPNSEPDITTVYSQKKGRFVDVPDLSLAYIIRFSKPIDIEQAIKEIKSLTEVQYAHQPVQTGTCLGEPNDPEYTAFKKWYLDKIEALDAWNLAHGSSSVKIAVIDVHGVKTNHEDLSSNYDGGDSVTHDGTHGTQVAGVAAAVTNNNTGIACLGWDTKFLSYRYDPDDEVQTELSVDIKDAADDGADIIVMSFATWKDTVINYKPGKTMYNFSLVEEAIEYADSLGVVLVASAGNEPPAELLDPYPFNQWPAQYLNVIGVSGTTILDSFMITYNYSHNGNELIDVAAPGKDIYTTSFSGSTDTYAYASGTSLSAPLVASLAALILSADSSLSSSEVQSIITSTAETVG